MLIERKDGLELQKKNLEDFEDRSLVSSQINVIERLEDYNLQVNVFVFAYSKHLPVCTVCIFVIHTFSAYIGP